MRLADNGRSPLHRRRPWQPRPAAQRCTAEPSGDV